MQNMLLLQWAWHVLLIGEYALNGLLLPWSMFFTSIFCILQDILESLSIIYWLLLSVCLSVCLPVCLSMCLSASACLSVCLSRPITSGLMVCVCVSLSSLCLPFISLSISIYLSLSFSIFLSLSPTLSPILSLSLSHNSSSFSSYPVSSFFSPSPSLSPFPSPKGPESNTYHSSGRELWSRCRGLLVNVVQQNLNNFHWFWRLIWIIKLIICRHKNKIIMKILFKSSTT